MNEEFITSNVDNTIKFLKEIHSSKNNNEDDVVSQEDYDNLRNLTKIICSPIYDENNYIDGQFKRYEIDEETKINLLACCDKMEQFPGLKKSDFDNYFLTNIQIIINLRGSLISSENQIKMLQTQINVIKNDCSNLYKMVCAKEEDNERLREKLKEQRSRKQNFLKNEPESTAIVLSQNKKGKQYNLDEKLLELDNIIKDKENQLADISKNLSETVLKNFEYEEKIKNIGKKLKDSTNELVSAKNSYRSQLNMLKTENDKLKAENEKLKLENQKLSNDNKTFKNIQAELTTLKNQMESLNQEYNMVILEKKNIKFLNDKFSSDYSKLLVEFDKIKNIKKQYDNLVVEHDSYKRKYEELNVNYIAINTGLTQSENKILHLTGQLEDCNKIIDTKNKIIDEKNKIIDETNKSLTISEKNLKNSNQIIKTLESKVEISKPTPIDTKIISNVSNIGGVSQVGQTTNPGNRRKNRKSNGLVQNQSQVNISSYATSPMTSPKVPQLIPLTQEQFLQLQAYHQLKTFQHLQYIQKIYANSPTSLVNQSNGFNQVNYAGNPYSEESQAQVYGFGDTIGNDSFGQGYVPYFVDPNGNYVDSNGNYYDSNGNYISSNYFDNRNHDSGSDYNQSEFEQNF